MRLIGIIPAAGLGSRLQPLPFSKELFPAGFQKINDTWRVSPISLYLVDALKKAGVHQHYFVISPQKTDIPRYFMNGSQFGIQVSYLYQPEPKGMVDALAQVTPWLSGEDEDTLIFFGMPDTYFQPASLFDKMKETLLENRDLQVVLGVFPVISWWKLGMVHFQQLENGTGEVMDILDKPKVKPDTDYAWGVAVWRLSFQRYLTKCQAEFKGEGELVLGDVFMRAKMDGMKLHCITGTEYRDLGTVDDLMRFVHETSRGQDEKK
ncbi:Glucose-1-phosphate thymidylyltransferase 2 [compost metagenome]